MSQASLQNISATSSYSGLPFNRTSVPSHRVPGSVRTGLGARNAVAGFYSIRRLRRDGQQLEPQ